MNIWKKSLLTFFAIFIGVSTLVPSFSFAQKWYAPSFEEFNEKVNGSSVPDSEIFGERYTQAQVYWIVHSLIVLLTGEELQKCLGGASGDILAFRSCLDPNWEKEHNLRSPQKLNYNLPPFTLNSPPLAIGALIDSTVSTRPASGVEYIAEKVQDITPISNAQTQNGFGYQTLEPVRKLWTATRNASYGLMVVVIIVLAFMIMLRKRISPQAVVSIQSAIPRIVVGLVLITFSYAIAGLLIDLAYLVMGVVSAILHVSGIFDPALRQAGPMDTFNALNGVVHGVFSLGLLLFINLFLFTILSGAGSLIPVVGGIFAMGTALGILLLIVTVIVFLYALLKIFFLLFKAYITLLLLIIVSPFFVLGWIAYAGSLSFSSWLRLFIGQLSIFIIVPLMVFFAHFITWTTSPSFALVQDWMLVNPFGLEPAQVIANVQVPAFTSISPTLVGFVGGLFIMLMIPPIATNASKILIGGRPDQRMDPWDILPYGQQIKKISSEQRANQAISSARGSISGARGVVSGASSAASGKGLGYGSRVVGRYARRFGRP